MKRAKKYYREIFFWGILLALICFCAACVKEKRTEWSAVLAEGKLYFRTEKGLACYDLQTKQTKTVVNGTVNHGLVKWEDKVLFVQDNKLMSFDPKNGNASEEQALLRTGAVWTPERLQSDAGELLLLQGSDHPRTRYCLDLKNGEMVSLGNEEVNASYEERISRKGKTLCLLHEGSGQNLRLTDEQGADVLKDRVQQLQETAFCDDGLLLRADKRLFYYGLAEDKLTEIINCPETNLKYACFDGEFLVLFDPGDGGKVFLHRCEKDGGAFVIRESAELS